jgi:glycosyltransferase involved in cell wall biosynthesis
MDPASSPSTAPVSTPQLIVVLPVYNEEQAATAVAGDWLRVLESLNIPFRLQFCNDGSTDGTLQALEAIRHPCLEIRSARNRGHGPTILRAYRSAMERAPWVFQTDSDGELPADAFPDFWAAREDSDLVIGMRTGRDGPWPRRVVTAGARLMLSLLFGRGIHDANCPYRLMRSPAFYPLMDQLPEDTFAPNVILSGYSLRSGLRIRELPVPFSPRRHGEGSIRTRRLTGIAWTCIRQTLAFRFRKPAAPSDA